MQGVKGGEGINSNKGLLRGRRGGGQKSLKKVIYTKNIFLIDFNIFLRV